MLPASIVESGRIRESMVSMGFASKQRLPQQRKQLVSCLIHGVDSIITFILIFSL